MAIIILFLFLQYVSATTLCAGCNEHTLLGYKQAYSRQITCPSQTTPVLDALTVLSSDNIMIFAWKGIDIMPSEFDVPVTGANIAGLGFNVQNTSSLTLFIECMSNASCFVDLYAGLSCKSTVHADWWVGTWDANCEINCYTTRQVYCQNPDGTTLGAVCQQNTKPAWYTVCVNSPCQSSSFNWRLIGISACDNYCRANISWYCSDYFNAKVDDAYCSRIADLVQPQFVQTCYPCSGPTVHMRNTTDWLDNCDSTGFQTREVGCFNDKYQIAMGFCMGGAPTVAASRACTVHTRGSNDLMFDTVLPIATIASFVVGAAISYGVIKKCNKRESHDYTEMPEVSYERVM